MINTDLIDAYKIFTAKGVNEKAHLCVVNMLRQDENEAIKYAKDLRHILTTEISKGNSVRENMDLIGESYINTGRYFFDDFMTAMEWERTPNARFWLPRRKVLEGNFGVATTIQNFINDPHAKYLGISCPPGVGKTTLIKFLLSYIGGKFPDSLNMYCSYADGMVKSMFDSLCAMMIDDEHEYTFSKIFPEVGKPKSSAEYSTVSFRKKGDFPTLGLVSLGGSVTGRTRANKFFVTDDLVKNDEVARSPERLETLWFDYNNTLTTRMIGEECKQIALGTIWSLYDPISRMKTKYEGVPGYYFIALPVMDELGHSNFNYEHPDRYTDEMVADLKDRLDPVIFSCLYMQQGVEKEGLAFSADRLQYYNGVLPDGEPDNIWFYTDVAWGGGDSLSMPIFYQYGDTCYVHDVIFDNRDKSVTRPRVIGKILQHKVKMGRFEANNGGHEYCDAVDKELRDTHNYSCNLSSKKATGNMAKLTRIEQHQDTIRTFYFRNDKDRGNDYIKFMTELTTFSFTSKNLHDDAADSLAGACDYRMNGKNEVKIRKRTF